MEKLTKTLNTGPVSPGFHQSVRKLAELEDTTVARLIRRLLREELQKNGIVPSPNGKKELT